MLKKKASYTLLMIEVSLILSRGAFCEESLSEEKAQAPEEMAVVATETPIKKEEETISFTKEELEREIFNKPITLELRDIDVLDALKFLSDKTGLNFVPTRNVSGRVSLVIENVPFKDLFDLILRSNGLAYAKIGNIYNIMTEAEYKAMYGKNFFDSRQVKVFRLKYAIPDQAFSLLEALKSDIGKVLVDKESGNVLLMDTPEKIVQIEKALEEFEKKNLVKVFSLKYSRAKDVEEILKARLEAKSVGSVQADERNNQLIVQALAERMKEVEVLIQRLDRPTKEVLIDAKIVKIRLNDQLDTGVEWEGIFKIAESFGTTYLGSYPFSYMSAGITNPTFQTRNETYTGEIGYYPFSGTTSSLSASTKVTVGENLHLGAFSSDKDYDLLINFLNTIGNVRVLANPKIVVVNNQEAKLHIGERQAYVTTTTTTGQTVSTVAEEVSFVDVGIQLSVTPRINDDGYITMKIKPEVSSVSSILVTPTNNKIPIVDTSMAETTVMVKDKTTLLIGGLRKEQKTRTSSETPLLGKVPVLGNLFRTRTDATERTELLVMITPHIISGLDLDMGDERAFGDKPGKDYQGYQPLSPEESLYPEKAVQGIEPKPYRRYLQFKEERE